MPLYEFKCYNCDNKFEALVSIGKEKSVVCPGCSSRNIKKCYSSFGIGGGNDRTASSGSCSTCSTISPSTCSTCR